MSLYFENTNSKPDFMPTLREYENYKCKLDRYSENINEIPRKKINLNLDNYDDYGRNISEQEKRQNKVPWTKVKYVNGKLLVRKD